MKTTFALIIFALALTTAAYAEIKINVLGAVNCPGHFIIEEVLGEQVTLLDALGLAHGVSEHGNPKKILIRRVGKVNTMEINLMDLIRSDTKIPILEDGDLVYVYERVIESEFKGKSKSINVLGAVNRQGHFIIEKDLGERVTLLDALGLANGISELGDSKNIVIRRVGEVNTMKIHLMDLIRSDTKIPIMKDGDVVYVSERVIE